MAIKASGQIDVLDLTDGYSVILTNESYTFLGTTSSVDGTQTTTTQIQVLQGSDTISCSVGSITTPTGLSIVSDGKTPSPTLTVTATSALTTSGSVEIPVIIGDVTIYKIFSWSIAFKGSTGSSGTSSYTYIRYATSSAGANMTSTPSDSTTYIGVCVTTSSTAPTSASSYTWSKYQGDDGEDGNDGADALTLVIISSNGQIFKNTSIATTLTAHVYKGGVEVTGSDLTALGTINWYKDGATTVTATGSSLTIASGDVTGSASYVAQLEG